MHMCFAVWVCVCCSTWCGGLEEELVVFTLPHTVNSSRPHCIRPSKVHLVSMKIFQPQNILTCQLWDVSFFFFSLFLGKCFLHLSQCSNPEICVVLCILNGAATGIYYLNSKWNSILRTSCYMMLGWSRGQGKTQLCWPLMSSQL